MSNGKKERLLLESTVSFSWKLPPKQLPTWKRRLSIRRERSMTKSKKASLTLTMRYMYSAQCWNYGNLIPNSVDIAEIYSYHHFTMWKSTIKSDHTQKVSVKSTLVVTTLVKILIWRKKCWFWHQTRDHVLCHTLRKFRNFAATILSQKFRAINFLL